MAKQADTGLPAHLKELLHPTPSGVAKLIAAWDGLTTESQILVLTELKEIKLPGYLREKLQVKALDSGNSYVRYLAAREFYFSEDDSDEKKALKKRIEDDPDALVRYCLLERRLRLHISMSELDDPDRFFKLPHEARLAFVRELTGNDERMAVLISHAVDHHLQAGKVSEIELFEILSDYVNKAEFRAEYYDDQLSYDGWGEFYKGKGIESLWRLVLKLPEGISHLLIEQLPPGAGLSPDIPEDVLQGMNDPQLETLFDRPDIGLKEFRRQKFFETDEERDVMMAAISHNFDLEYSEFAEILAKPDKERVRCLTDLAMMACDLSLCIYDAIHDALFNPPVKNVETAFAFEDAIFARDALERRLEELESWQRDEQLQKLRLYRLARRAVPWKKDENGYPPSGALEFLAELVVEGDTWATFMAFSDAWAENSCRTKKLEKNLPRIYEADEDELADDISVD